MIQFGRLKKMTRKYLNDRWCARCGRLTPTPYLVKNQKLFPENGVVLDIGCGNGRNTNHLRLLGYSVDPIDMVDQPYSMQIVLGHDDLPQRRYDIILANYVLMFLDENERSKVMYEILDRAKENAILMIEMYPAKDAHDYDFDEIVKFFLDRGWSKLRKSKDKCVLKFAV